MAIRVAILALLLVLVAPWQAHAAGRILLDGKEGRDDKGGKGGKGKDDQDQFGDWGNIFNNGNGGGGFGQGGANNGGGRFGQGGFNNGPGRFGQGGFNNGGGRFGQGGGRNDDNRGGGRGFQRYDRQIFSGLVPSSPPSGFGSRRGQGLSADAQRLSQSFATASATSTAQSIVGGGNSYAIAEAIVDTAARGRGSSIATAFASAASLNRGRTADLLSQSASVALARGQVDPFARATASAFTDARRRGSLRNFGLAVADAVSRGGQNGQYAYGKALATAIAGGGDGQQAVAEATAEVFCSGSNSYASAWSSAFAIALNQDQNGCLVLSKARALASASCGGGAFNSFADSEATSKVLGFCGLFPPGAGPQFNFNSANNGASSFGGK